MIRRGCPSGCRGGTGQTEAAPQMQPRAGETVNTRLPGPLRPGDPASLPACPARPRVVLLKPRRGECQRALRCEHSIAARRGCAHSARVTQGKALSRTGHCPPQLRSREPRLPKDPRVVLDLAPSLLSSQPHSQVNSGSWNVLRSAGPSPCPLPLSSHHPFLKSRRSLSTRLPVPVLLLKSHSWL